MRTTYTDILEALDDIEIDHAKLQGLVKEVWDAIKHGSYNKALYISQDIQKIAYALKLEAVDMQLAAEQLSYRAKDLSDDE